MSANHAIYNLFPLLAGSTHQWEAHLPRIASMGFRWVYLNPFHYPGFSGSLYAIKDFHRLHPVVQGESQDHPDALLRRFVDVARDHGLQVMLDLVINHTSKDALWVDSHPDFYLRDSSGSLISPSAIDPADARNVTVWGDLAELDYHSAARGALVEQWKRLLSRYLDLGFRGFRCDAAYKVPSEVWQELISFAKSHAPVLFLAETLGCRLEESQRLAGAGFDMFFNSSKWWDFKAPWLLEQYQSFRAVAPSVAFPESHDTPRLRRELKDQNVLDETQIEAHYRLRYLFASFFSSSVLMPQGFEFGAGNNLDVVHSRPNAPSDHFFDLCAFIGAANQTKSTTPALTQEGPQSIVQSPSDLVALHRQSPDGSSHVLALIHPASEHACQVRVDDIPILRERDWQVVCDTCPGAVQGDARPGGTMGFLPLSMRILRA